METPTRQVVCADTNAWLEAQGALPGCVITSLPNTSEIPELSFDRWKVWFREMVAKLIDRTPADGAAIFYQTDIKRDGAWVDKGFLVQLGAEHAGAKLLWHKVVCRRPPGTVTFGRPAYAHLLCFSRGLRADPGRSTPDVLPELGEMTWSRAMGVEACKEACRFVLRETSHRTIIDPFCGVGTVLAVANAMGLNSLGVELSRRRAARAKRLEISWPSGGSQSNLQPDAQPSLGGLREPHE